MSRYELSHACTANSAGLVFYSSSGLTAVSQTEVEALLRTYDYAPVIADLSIPQLDISALYTHIGPNAPSVLLESLGPGRHARYSIIAFNPSLTTAYTFPSQVYETNPLNTFMSSVRAPVLNLPHYYGGPICAWGYDAGLAWHGLPIHKQGAMASFPDLFYFLPRQVLVYDHQTELLTGIVWLSQSDKPYDRFQTACELLQEMFAAARKVAPDYKTVRDSNLDMTKVINSFSCNMTRAHFRSLVEKAKMHINCGDIFQAVVSQRWTYRGKVNPWNVYQELRLLNPSPYMFYLDGPDFTILGASPETQLRVQQQLVTIHPIAGTRPISGDPVRDETAAKELLEDEKERAEHLMLVDLARNDIGRTSITGTVKVPRFMERECYSHVMHLVSEVTGELKPELMAADAFAACFPAGTLTGAPKRKAIEIIDQLEDESRGIYGGAVGYLNFNNNLDSGIAIRTILFYQGIYYIQTGAGIVADSDSDKEYEETFSKAKAMMAALLQAEERL